MNATVTEPRFPGETVATSWLASHLEAPWLRVVDVREGDAPAGGGGPRFVEIGAGAGWVRAGAWSSATGPSALFLEEHIPGAVALDVGHRFFDDTGALLWTAEIALVMSELGVGSDHTIVLVDDRQPAAALVAASILRRAGHPRTGILAGGYARWVAEGRSTTNALVRHPAASFRARLR